MQKIIQKITPFLWFNNQAEEAMNFYVSVFDNSRVLRTVQYGDMGPGPKGTVMTADFLIEGQEFVALNGGPAFTFSQATSFVVNCTTQEEVDRFWEKLSDGGEKQQCGWLKDKFGVSWQIVPVVLSEMLSDPDPVKSQTVMKALLPMMKIEIKKLQQAYSGKK